MPKVADLRAFSAFRVRICRKLRHLDTIRQYLPYFNSILRQIILTQGALSHTFETSPALQSFLDVHSQQVLCSRLNQHDKPVHHILTRINRKSFFAFPPRFKYNKENIGGCIHVTYG